MAKDKKTSSSDSISLMAVQEAFQDPFQQGNQNLMDSKHLGEINPEWGNRQEWKKVAKKLSFVAIIDHFMAQPGYTTAPIKNKAKNQPADDPDKLFRTYPSFDPVFMKI